MTMTMTMTMTIQCEDNTQYTPQRNTRSVMSIFFEQFSLQL